MAMFKHGVCLILLFWIDFAHGSGLKDLPEAQLQRKLIDGQPLARPLRNYSDTMHVAVVLLPLCLKELNVAKQELSLVAGLSMAWKNEFLAWDPEEYSGTRQTYIPSTATWKPFFQVSNSVIDAANYEDASQSQYILIYANGYMVWSMSQKFQTYCNVDVVYFPFDTQYCCITITNWMSSSEYTQFISTPMDTGHLIKSTEWSVLNTESYTDEIDIGDDMTVNMSQANFCLKLQRRSSFYISTIIIPLFLLSFVGLFVFPLPPASGEKISLCVACLMSFSITQVSISAHLPTSWNSVPLIMILNICFMVMNVLSVCVTVLNLHLYLKEESDSRTGLSFTDLLPANWKCIMRRKGSSHVGNQTGELQGEKDSVNLTYTGHQTDVPVHQGNVNENAKVEKTDKGNEKKDRVQKRWKDQAVLLNTGLSYVFVSIFLLLLTIFGILWFQHYQTE